MKKIAICRALGVAAAWTAVRALDGETRLDAGPGGGGVGVRGWVLEDRSGDDYPCERRYYDYDDGPAGAFGVGPGWHDGWHGHHWHR